MRRDTGRASGTNHSEPEWLSSVSGSAPMPEGMQSCLAGSADGCASLSSPNSSRRAARDAEAPEAMTSTLLVVPCIGQASTTRYPRLSPAKLWGLRPRHSQPELSVGFFLPHCLESEYLYTETVHLGMRLCQCVCLVDVCQSNPPWYRSCSYVSHHRG